MSPFMIKRATLAFSLCLAWLACSNAEASENTQQQSGQLETRVSSLESRMGAIKTRTAKGTVGAKMATARPLIDGYGFFVTADLLFWQLREMGTQYVIKSKDPSTAPVHGNSKQVHFNWDFGFRVGGGYNFEHDEWDTQLFFSWFRTDGNSHAHASDNGTLFPQWGIPAGNGDFGFGKRARINWDVSYAVIDLELARNFFVSKYLAIRPLFGLETAWITQKMNFHERFLSNPNQMFSHLHLKGKNDFWGIGPRAGVETTWYFGEHFSLFGGVSGALLWGDFDVREKEKLTGEVSRKLTNGDGDFNAMVPNAKAILGLQWDTNFSENCHHIGIKLGYEFQYWWRQNQMLNIYNPSYPIYERESADLSLSGLTLDFRFDF